MKTKILYILIIINLLLSGCSFFNKEEDIDHKNITVTTRIGELARKYYPFDGSANGIKNIDIYNENNFLCSKILVQHIDHEANYINKGVVTINGIHLVPNFESVIFEIIYNEDNSLRNDSLIIDFSNECDTVSERNIFIPIPHLSIINSSISSEMVLSEEIFNPENFLLIENWNNYLQSGVNYKYTFETKVIYLGEDGTYYFELSNDKKILRSGKYEMILILIVKNSTDSFTCDRYNINYSSVSASRILEYHKKINLK